MTWETRKSICAYAETVNVCVAPKIRSLCVGLRIISGHYLPVEARTIICTSMDPAKYVPRHSVLFAAWFTGSLALLGQFFLPEPYRSALHLDIGTDLVRADHCDRLLLLCSLVSRSPISTKQSPHSRFAQASAKGRRIIYRHRLAPHELCASVECSETISGVFAQGILTGDI